MPKAATNAAYDQLTRARILRDYRKAFVDATGMPLVFSPAAIANGRNGKNGSAKSFCELASERSPDCAECRKTGGCRSGLSCDSPGAAVCFAGFCRTRIPVHIGQQLAGYLETGRFLTRPPTRGSFRKIAARLVDWGLKPDLKLAREAYLSSKVLPEKKRRAAEQLLRIFAEHLALMSNQLLLRRRVSSPVVAHAQEFIRQHHGERLGLREVARAVHISSFYFCKLFRRQTGLHFTDYLARTRVEHAKTLLGDPHLRVSEIAFETGFQSVTHFNRTFKRIVGRSPSSFRGTLAS